MSKLNKSQELTSEEKLLLKPIEKKPQEKDVALKTKQIGSLRDSLNRFAKNKASVVAAIIIGILILFTLIGPFLKPYNLHEIDHQSSIQFNFLPPKIPLLEKLGIFDGSQEVVKNKNFIDQLPEGIVLETIQEGIEGNQVKVKVDFYKYTNFIKSYMREDGSIPTRNLTQRQFDEALNRNAVIDIINTYTQTSTITEDGVSTTVTEQMYIVRIDLFKFALNQSTDDTYFWFGTMHDARDLFPILWEGARLSLSLALLISTINIIIGIILGALAGYYGGTFDLIFDRIVDILAALPLIAIITLLIIRYGTQVWVVIAGFIVTGWLGAYARTRMQFYRFKNREYVLAARSLGANDRRIMFKHILPNAIGTLVTTFSLAIPAFIASEAVYSYLGIIDYGSAVGVGQLLSFGQRYMTLAPHMLVIPAVYIGILMLSFNLFGNGLRDAFNTSLRGSD